MKLQTFLTLQIPHIYRARALTRGAILIRFVFFFPYVPVCASVFHSYPPTSGAKNLLRILHLPLYAIPFSITLPIGIHLITDDSHKYECDTRCLLVGCNRIHIAHYYCCYDFTLKWCFEATHMQIANNKEHLAKSKPSHCVTVLFHISLSLRISFSIYSSVCFVVILAYNWPFIDIILQNKFPLNERNTLKIYRVSLKTICDVYMHILS